MRSQPTYDTWLKRVRDIPTRTAMAKELYRVRKELIFFVGGKPDISQALLIERCAERHVRCLHLCRAMFGDDQALAERAEQNYARHSEALSRDLQRLGARPTAPEPAPDLHQYLDVVHRRRGLHMIAPNP